MNQPDAAGLKEILARSRRIETRLTSLCNHHNVPSGAQKPEYDRGGLRIHSAHTSVKELLDSIPDECEGSCRVYLGDQLVMTIVRPGN